MLHIHAQAHEHDIDESGILAALLSHGTHLFPVGKGGDDVERLGHLAAGVARQQHPNLPVDLLHLGVQVTWTRLLGPAQSA